MQQATVVLGIDDALGRAREPGEVLRAIQLAQRLVVLNATLSVT